jgi:hypothetical protein
VLLPAHPDSNSQSKQKGTTMTKRLNVAALAMVSSFICSHAYAQFDLGKLKDAAKQMQSDAEAKNKPPATQQPAPTPSPVQKPTAPATGQNSLLQSIIKLVVVPETDGVGTAQGWENLNAVMPSVKWVVSQDKRYPFARSATIKDKSGTVTITVGGARTMVTEVSAAFGADYEIDIDKFLASSVKSKQVCVIEDMASAKDIYYEVTLPGYKPAIFHHEYSSGSGGGFDTVGVGSIDLPKACSKTPKQATNAQSGAKPAQAPGGISSPQLEKWVETCASFDSYDKLEKEIKSGNVSYKGVRASNAALISGGDGDAYEVSFAKSYVEFKNAFPDLAKTIKLPKNKKYCPLGGERKLIDGSAFIDTVKGATVSCFCKGSGG